jgi:hypothetical protein
MFGCSPLVLKWFTSYLSDRYQLTYFKNTLSDMRPVYLFIYFAIKLIHSLAGKPQQLLPITAAPIVIQKQFTRYTKHTQ